MPRTLLVRTLPVLLAAFLATASWAEGVKVDNAWVRATAPGQKVAGAFMTLTAERDMTLVSAESPASKIVELHTMRMDDGVMIMREVKSIDLPKGQPVSLKPGGLHVMLIDLNGPIAPGSQTEITLVIKDKTGATTRIPVSAEGIKPGGMGHMKQMR